MKVRKGTGRDENAVRLLLERSDLPLDGVADCLGDFVVAESDGKLLACAGIERFGRLGLLRSVAVDAAERGSGLGLRIVQSAIGDAKESGVVELVLLTTTAHDFFARHFAFEETTREAYGDAFAASPEWNLPRCSTAVVMRKLLR
jgi:amino-acid N-acetyltransferase